jgi:hypothetical protein
MDEFEKTLAEFVVDETRLDESAKFKVLQDIIGVYVNQTLVDRAMAADLKGFLAEQIYPIENGKSQLSPNVAQSVVMRFGFPANVEQTR